MTQSMLRQLPPFLAIVGLFAIPGIASAHAGNNDANVVHACIANASKLVRIVGVDGACISAPAPVAETPAHWAIAGLQGTPGADGKNGVDGTSVIFVGNFVGDQNGCTNGGAIFAVGNVVAYVCNGSNSEAQSQTRPAPPCFDNSSRFVDCGNGTVTDTVTQLVWLKHPDCLAWADYAAANQSAATIGDGMCGLTDGSSPGDWRLPTVEEWKTLVERAIAMGCAPSLLDDSGRACFSTGSSSFTAPTSDAYWSASAHQTEQFFAWAVNTRFGEIQMVAKTFPVLGAWAVRRGARP